MLMLLTQIEVYMREYLPESLNRDWFMIIQQNIHCNPQHLVVSRYL